MVLLYCSSSIVSFARGGGKAMFAGVLGLVEEACCGEKEVFSVVRSFGLDGPQSSARLEWPKKIKSRVGGVSPNPACMTHGPGVYRS